MKNENESFLYQLVYYNNINNNTIEGKIKNEKKRRGFSFSDDEGFGYIYPLFLENQNDNEVLEYKVEGHCSCCFECIEDENCKKNMFCVDKTCVECKNDNDCINKMVCHNGRCLNNVYCKNNDDCHEDEICNFNGDCLQGCKNDDNCETNQICSFDGKCVTGCRIDDNCNNNEICINLQCTSSGCIDNFDCNNYDNVCINNECIPINENTKNCISDNDCSNDYYCDFEYLVCVKMRKDITINRRGMEVLPTAAVCTVYGIISLFVLSSSYSIVDIIGRERLLDECDKRCSNLYYTSDGSESHGSIDRIEKLQHVLDRKDSKCTGKCRYNGKLKVEWAIEYGKTWCIEHHYSKIITNKHKYDYLEIHIIKDIRSSVTRNIFKIYLSAFCKSHTYWYDYIYTSGEKKALQTRCVADLKSMNCEVIK